MDPFSETVRFEQTSKDCGEETEFELSPEKPDGETLEQTKRDGLMFRLLTPIQFAALAWGDFDHTPPKWYDANDSL